MQKIRTMRARGAATQLVALSFTLPGVIERRGFLRAMDRIFSATASSYDRIWEKMGTSVVLAPLDRALQEFSEPPARILDLACGTGLAAFRLAETFPKARIVGADISQTMLNRFQTKAGTGKGGNLFPLLSPSGNLPFADNTFDLVLTQNAPPYPEEMVRVLRPGGSFFLLFSFVFVAPVRRIVRQRLLPLALCDIKIEKAAEGMAVTARKCKERRS